MKPKIYCFVNSGHGTDWQIVTALTEDGEFLAQHCSSSEGFARHDIGITSDWKHEHYRERYPDGYELEWVSGLPSEHAGVIAAHGKHVAHGERGSPWQQGRAVSAAKLTGDAEVSP